MLEDLNLVRDSQGQVGLPLTGQDRDGRHGVGAPYGGGGPTGACSAAAPLKSARVTGSWVLEDLNLLRDTPGQLSASTRTAHNRAPRQKGATAPTQDELLAEKASNEVGTRTSLRVSVRGFELLASSVSENIGEIR